MVLWLENTSSPLCTQGWQVLHTLYNMTCDSVTFLGNFCHYDDAVQYINNSIRLVPEL